MRAVLYTYDMEPITVLDIQPWAWEFLIEQGSVRLTVLPSTVAIPDPDRTPTKFDMHRYTVTITAETLVRGRHKSLMLFTNDEEAALLLKSELLPGQHRGVQDREKQAFAKGFVDALNMMGKR